ncbi:unnamed protein product [Didymodactylos carnosus]|uniref:Uncharacterized protein n=1 Tax=Didymodactylos carnosus TaxID=1234261 RepID=A0A814Z228_9BILA|nr:unnamed protein product [Didymodactylos carnosus]CAF3998920.1 unnamed protein product [Didymodactylos carnosus]
MSCSTINNNRNLCDTYISCIGKTKIECNYCSDLFCIQHLNEHNHQRNLKHLQEHEQRINNIPNEIKDLQLIFHNNVNNVRKIINTSNISQIEQLNLLYKCNLLENEGYELIINYDHLFISKMFVLQNSIIQKIQQQYPLFTIDVEQFESTIIKYYKSLFYLQNRIKNLVNNLSKLTYGVCSTKMIINNKLDVSV